MNNALETVMKSRLASKGHKLEVHEGRLQDTLARQLRSVEENASVGSPRKRTRQDISRLFSVQRSSFFNTESNAEKLSPQ